MNTLKQIFYEFRNQPIIGWVTIAGTTLTVMLIMVVVAMQQIDIAPIAPETHRDRLLYGQFFYVTNPEEYSNSSSALSLDMAHRLYDSIPGVEHSCIVTSWKSNSDISVKGKSMVCADIQSTDAGFWRVFDFAFIDGKPYDEAAVASSLKQAVITESIARRLFDATDVAGREIFIGKVPYVVVGVVRDVSTLTRAAYSQVYVPVGINSEFEEVDLGLGNYMAILLTEGAHTFADIKAEVRRRYELVSNGNVLRDGFKAVYMNQPYTQEEYIAFHGSNSAPDTESSERTRLAIYIILLIIPAINLSSMTHSRLRRRVVEIGVRRAFGCTRLRVVSDILTENFVVTMVGGLLGYVLSIAFVSCFDYALFASFFNPINPNVTAVTPSMLISGRMFLWTLFFCFLLNLLSSGIPAWRAARVNPVDAINRK